MDHNIDMHSGNYPIKIGSLCLDPTPKLSRGQVPRAMLLRPPHTSVLACVSIAITTKSVKSFRLSSSPIASGEQGLPLLSWEPLHSLICGLIAPFLSKASSIY